MRIGQGRQMTKIQSLASKQQYAQENVYFAFPFVPSQLLRTKKSFVSFAQTFLSLPKES